MKKYIVAMLMVVLCFSFAACNDNTTHVEKLATQELKPDAIYMVKHKTCEACEWTINGKNVEIDQNTYNVLVFGDDTVSMYIKNGDTNISETYPFTETEDSVEIKTDGEPMMLKKVKVNEEESKDFTIVYETDNEKVVYYAIYSDDDFE